MYTYFCPGCSLVQEIKASETVYQYFSSLLVYRRQKSLVGNPWDESRAFSIILQTVFLDSNHEYSSVVYSLFYNNCSNFVNFKRY